VNRRNLIRTAMGLPLLADGLFKGLALGESKVGNARSIRSRVRPADPAWPGAASWAKLKEQVGGNLIEVHPLFGACEGAPNGADCLTASKNIDNPFYIGDQPGGTQVCGWFDAWTPAASAYAVKARNAADVAAAVHFARDNNLRLVVKGTGHSYLGTSSAPDSLLVWTRGMNAVTLHDSFVGQGCAGKVAPVPAVTAEAGAVWIDLYTAVTTNAGRYVQGGGCTDVGVAGLVQSGGFGSFSRGFGTAASGLLEAEIVTADGATRIANACTNSDLYWALKGGGGGSWGVVTKLTLRTHDLPQFMGWAWGTVKARSDEAFRKLIQRFVSFYTDNLFNPIWGEQVHFAPDNTFEISMSSHGLNGESAQAVWKPFFEWITASPNDYAITDEFGASGHEARQMWHTEGNPSMTLDPRAGAPKHHGWWKGDQGQVGAFLNGYDSLWLPARLLHEDQGRRLSDALFAGSRHKKIDLHINKGLAGATPDAVAATLDTATNAAVTQAFALAIIADGQKGAYPGEPRAAIDLEAARRDARAIDLAAAELRKIAPNAGSYVSESNFFNRDWQRDYWGKNYARLRAIKTKYDPDGLFFVHHGVGSEDWSADGFTRRV
jgi:FAD/FMN-containing dehydrogenase